MRAINDTLGYAPTHRDRRFLETSGVLGAWAIFGFVVAPALLRRMARRESGSSVTPRREEAATIRISATDVTAA
ncbi:MAG: type transporter [Sphaerisporangium sp.]|nr:type transporter [Sphaerisporangium sp.]